MKHWSVFVCLISLVTPAPQLNIPANVFTSSSNGDIEAELSSVSVEDEEDQVFNGRDLVSVLNNRVRPGVTRVTSVNNGVIRTRPVSTTNRVFSSRFMFHYKIPI